MASTHQVGQRLSFDGALCTIRFIGDVAGTSGTWLGVEWDDPSRGKHDGCHKGVRYFTCLSRSPTAASFVRPTRPSDPPRSFVDAVRDKYADEPEGDAASRPKEIVISGKVAEEVGFDKIRRRMAQLHELTIVIVDGARIAFVCSPHGSSDHESSVKETCPRIVELDISRNLISDISVVVEICSQLSDLRSLRLNGNRFWNVLDKSPRLASAREVLSNITELAIDETLLSWEEICQITSCFGSLQKLSCDLNQISSIPAPFPATLSKTLTTLSLEFNDFSSLSDLAPLSTLTSLRNLILKGNNIATASKDDTTPGPVFSSSIYHLDISYNRITTWKFVDALPDSFPGLRSLRLAHNPVYENPTSVSQDVGGTASSQTQPGDSTTATTAPKRSVSEDPYMITIARVACLEHLNFSAITPAERTDAEMFYLSRIARQLATVPEGSEDPILAQHRRYAELCELYGEPAVMRQQEISHSFLEGRLIKVDFRIQGSSGTAPDGVDVAAAELVKKAEIPRALDMYAVKGIAGRLFGISPLELRLVWETGEWDPVAGFDEDDDEDSSPDDGGAGPDTGPTAAEGGNQKHGRLVRRQVELVDSPRQFGYCIDGNEAKIRVERISA
ncbi:hypothetical protein PpBr36_08771 [Pyricularia pennisetigena]|uniref:hypothetical protein n=1 Tax=Pyricularia pennisetigena TaxID=1578925 RepID=UPI00114D61A7|nr:hypothetical protein PpBr36_08771 [Pyricularia pennisetigena]TLS24449.1 hypothetical protein PpBr36_08771 [Pyricularia pennisetigena]